MRYLKYCFVMVFFVVSCMEYTIDDNNEPILGEPNPPQLVPEVKTDVITQVAKHKVDVLWVIDNSCSMREEQATLVNSFEYFINYFLNSQLDWHIGVTSTDMDSRDEPGSYGTLNSIGNVKYIDSNTPNPIAVFQDMASLGISGSGIERGIEAAFTAIAVHGNNGSGHNENFYREDANLSIIAISDEEDFSVEPALPEFIDWLTNLKKDVDMVNFSSIVCLQPGSLNGIPCGQVPSAVSVGAKYMSVTQAVGGILWDIREDDWDPVLDQLGIQAAGLKTEFFLTDLPVVETLDVWVVVEAEDSGEGTYHYNFDFGTDYTYSRIRNSITFTTFVPPEFSKVEIYYIPLGTYNYGDTGQDSGQ